MAYAIYYLIMIGITIIVIIRFYNTTIVPSQRERAQKRTAKLITYNENTLTATLITRDPQIADVIKIADAMNYDVKYDPVKVHYGSATVGGVTTGGTYTTGGKNYIAGSSKSGLFNLEYAEHMVTHIQLTSEQYNLAKKSKIASYLNESTKQIDVHANVQYTQFEMQIAMKNLATTGYVGNDKRGYPSREKCEAILNWLCGNNL